MWAFVGLPLVAQAQGGGQSFDSAANDPTASIMSFLLHRYQITGCRDLPNTHGSLSQLRAAHPFKLGGIQNVTQPTLPDSTDSPSAASDISDTTVSTQQSIVKVSLEHGWSVDVSQMNIGYDLSANDFASLPHGAKPSKLTKPGGIPMKWPFSYEHDFTQGNGTAEDTFGLTAKSLLPA